MSIRMICEEKKKLKSVVYYALEEKYVNLQLFDLFPM